jgi:hypothetical protein
MSHPETTGHKEIVFTYIKQAGFRDRKNKDLKWAFFLCPKQPMQYERGVE